MSPTSLRLLGVHFSTEPPAVREALALSADAVAEFLGEFNALFSDSGLLVLSTCARLEFYIDASDSHAEMAHRAFGSMRGGGHCPALAAASYEFESEDTASHLFRVASGLESPILGDVQVLAQLRTAESQARRARTLTPTLSELVRRALVLGKAVRRETTISAGGADVGSAVFNAIEETCQNRSKQRVLIVGAGAAASSVVDAMVKHGPFATVIANRNLDRARSLADRVGGTAVGLADLPEAARRVEVIVVATAPGHRVLDAADVREVLRSNTALVVIDLVPGGAIPREAGLTVIGLDDLTDWSDPRRLAALDEVEARCAATEAAWRVWRNARPVESAISDLYSGLDQVTQLLADIARSTPQPGGTPTAEVRTILKNWLHPHAAQLRSISVDREVRGKRASHPSTHHLRGSATVGGEKP